MGLERVEVIEPERADFGLLDFSETEERDELVDFAWEWADGGRLLWLLLVTDALGVGDFAGRGVDFVDGVAAFEGAFEDFEETSSGSRSSRNFV